MFLLETVKDMIGFFYYLFFAETLTRVSVFFYFSKRFGFKIKILGRKNILEERANCRKYL